MALRSARRSKRRAEESPESGMQPRRTVEETPSLPADPSLPPTTGWLRRGKDGRLSAYTPGADGVLRWTETRPGGPEWEGPQLFPSPGVTPSLGVAQGSDGYVQLVGLRQTRAADGELVTDLAQTLQYQSGRPIRDWSGFGTPYPKDKELADRIGRPAAAVDTNGLLHVFIANACGGVCGRTQHANGRWGKWADLKGSNVQGVPAVTLTDAGVMEVVAVSPDRVLRWVQQEPGAAFFDRADDIEVSAVPGSVSAERTGRGRLTHFWRDAATGAVQAWREGMDQPAALGGSGGTGPVALLRTPVDGHDCTIIAQLGRDGRPELAAYPTEDESAGTVWTATGEPCVGAPALAIDGNGRVVLAAFGSDGALRVTRQKAETGLAMEAWTVV
ncbi:hypothetical protein ACFU5O_25705 [Streptomyces sp. NPDC057445]|uniref:hypothetical protein n=1 Tax=Streptomyces sp. NPDC057445 TaxID=3346136 RepID=UPI0036CFA059